MYAIDFWQALNLIEERRKTIKSDKKAKKAVF